MIAEIPGVLGSHSDKKTTHTLINEYDDFK